LPVEIALLSVCMMTRGMPSSTQIAMEREHGCSMRAMPLSPHRGGCQTLGTAVFSGMIGVTLFGLIFTPVFYVITRRARPASAPAAERAGARAKPRASPAE
jgi:hypothetical protein